MHLHVSVGNFLKAHLIMHPFEVYMKVTFDMVNIKQPEIIQKGERGTQFLSSVINRAHTSSTVVIPILS